MISTRSGIHLHSQFLYKQIEIQLCFYSGNYDGKVAKVDVEGFPEFLTSASLSLRGTARRGLLSTLSGHFKLYVLSIPLPFAGDRSF